MPAPDHRAGESAGLESEAIRARDDLRARAEAVRSGDRTPTPAATSSPCDGYFAAAVAIFAMAAQAQDPQLFLDLYQSAEAHLQLGQSCLERIGGSRGGE